MGSMQRIEVGASVDSLGPVRDFVEAQARAAGFSSEGVAELVLAVDEAVSNVVEHGFRSAAGAIEIEVAESPDALVVRIRDNAPLFDPTALNVASPASSPLLADVPGGYGLMLVDKLVDQVSYRVADGPRNELALRKTRPQREPRR